MELALAIAGLLLISLGSARIALLIAADEIFAPVRGLFMGRRFIGPLVHCTDCLTVWIAVFSGAGMILFPHETIALHLVAATALLSGAVARRY